MIFIYIYIHLYPLCGTASKTLELSYDEIYKGVFRYVNEMSFGKHLKIAGGELVARGTNHKSWKVQSHPLTSQEGSKTESMTSGQGLNQPANVMKPPEDPKRTGLEELPGW